MICDCMGLVSRHVDTASLEALAPALEGVVHVERAGLICNAVELAALARRLREHACDRLLFAGCSPRMSLRLPEERLRALASDAHLDPARIEVANVREQCAWIHPDDMDAASRKARDLLRMAHARLEAGDGTAPHVPLERRALVLGAGPAGLAAARDLARGGIEAVLVEREDHVGGTLCRLPFVLQTEAWPSTCETSCVVPLLGQEVVLSPSVELHTSAWIERLEQREGNFHAAIRVAPRRVDPERCFSCGLCEPACPEQRSDGRRAISKAFARALPDTYSILDGTCTLCGECVKVCPTQAIDLQAHPALHERSVGAVILATGTREREPQPALTGGRHPDVVTALELERLLAQGLRRPSDGEPAEHVVFVQCAGSRVSVDSERTGVPYCSKTCCAITAKQAKRIAATAPETEVSVVYYRDFRTYERALEKLHQDLGAMGITFVNGEVLGIAPGAEGGLAVSLAPTAGDAGGPAPGDASHGAGPGPGDERRAATEGPDADAESDAEADAGGQTLSCDLVVLACAQEPDLPELGLGLALDAFGFPIEAQPRILRPTETFVDRVFAVGNTSGPKMVQQAVEQGSVAALRAIEALGAGARVPVKHASAIEAERCSGCGVCVAVCPHGAVRIEEGRARVERAFCQGCGLCAASCPAHAPRLGSFSDELLLREARVAFTEAEPGEPRLLALLCYFCAYAGADLAGVDRLRAPASFRPVRIRCSSSVNLGLIVELFRSGVDGIVVCGCPHHSCHHLWGNWLAEKRLALMRTLLGQMGLDERRLSFENVGLAHARKLVEILERKRQELAALGPNPWRAAAGAVDEAQRSWLAS